MGKTSKSTPELAINRFWEKVNKKSDNECWEWIGYRGYKGYGQINICQKRHLTHRFSYELHKGKIPQGKEVCHSCDNPSCVNPNHLFLGTHKENMQDMSNKKRYNHPEENICRGEKNGNSKLKLIEVQEIRKKYIPFKITHKKLAEEYGVSEITIRKIIKGSLWGKYK